MTMKERLGASLRDQLPGTYIQDGGYFDYKRFCNLIFGQISSHSVETLRSLNLNY